MSANNFVVSLPADVQIAVVESLQPTLLLAVASASDVHLNCAQVQRIDSAGLQLLLACAQAVHSQGKRMLLSNMTAPMRDCLRLLGADSLFDDV